MLCRSLPFLFIIVYAACCIDAAGTSTALHTETYDQWKAGHFHDTFYLPDTFLDKHRCTALSSDNSKRREQYIKLLSDNNIECQGSWCIDGKFKCLQGNSKSCYNIEHIVDTKQSILPNHNKNIVGNIIMAYGKWNQEMGTMLWDNVESEKREIYGNSIVDMAIENIQFCHDKHQTPVVDDDGNDALPDEEGDVDGPENEPYDNSNLIGYVVGGIVLVGLIFVIYLIIRYAKHNIEPHQITNSDSASDIDIILLESSENLSDKEHGEV